ncbi:hypothetical protein [Nitrospira moscoviensis]|uniref:Uncharacterized protein n=1 Tax=Nitrospira moscoviensis TaxID=42253 RepID=A0A0K2GF69_NITMO|nr:hypothetical protein [Nitrospira moscoviensis]ALA59252.1 hypothetical protein NITMOv2_2844 [Nitrospira moscoviensis]
MTRQTGEARCFPMRGAMRLAFIGWALFAGGCALLEDYEAEKTRCLNFERLIARDERRVSHLDSELKQARRELAELDEKHRKLIAQVKAVQAELALVQEEKATIQETARLQADSRRLSSGSQEQVADLYENGNPP